MMLIIVKTFEVDIGISHMELQNSTPREKQEIFVEIVLHCYKNIL